MRAFAFAVVSCLAGNAFAQTSVPSIPVGSIDVVIPAADPSQPSMKALSVPFNNVPSYVGGIYSLDASNKLSVTGAPWVSGDMVSVPTYVRLKSGLGKGRFFLVNSNTSSQVTLDTGGFTLVSSPAENPNQIQVNVGDKVECIPASTLGTLFGANSTQLQTGANATLADNVLLYDGTRWKVYFHDGTTWRNPQADGSQNNVVIPPNTGFFVRHRGASPLTLVFSGIVPTTPEAVGLSKGSSRFTGNRFPMDSTLAGLGLQSTQGWTSGVNASAADGVKLWNGVKWEHYYYNGTNWRKAGSILNYDDVAVPAGSGIYVVRQKGSTADVTLGFAVPYAF